ncbi:MAG: hypothetical protein Q7J67_01285 [bacterium]|nr:hypothetical protein [bacterium]
MENIKDNEFCIGKTEYSFKDNGLGFRLNKRESSYYEFFKILKDNEDWSVVDMGIANKVLVRWNINEKQIDQDKFLLQIFSHIIKIGIYHNEISKIEEGEEVKSYLLCFPMSKNSNKNKIRVFSTPDETLEYWKNQANEIDNPRIGFR